MSYKDKAKELFFSGYNCTQAVVCAFADVIGIDEITLRHAASSFGGGMGGMREVCGCVSGMSMVLGFLYGYDKVGDFEAKKTHYARVRYCADKFKEKNGSIVCRELLTKANCNFSADPQKRTEEYYKKRPCPEIVGMCAEILEEYIKENKIINV